MPSNGNTKMKLLLLMDFLNKYSDEEHPISSGELCAMLKEKGVVCERKSVYRDISILADYGLDVIHAYSPKQGFFVARREFELAEIRLLMDAVLTAPFITNKKTAILTEKLSKLLSKYQADCVSEQVYIDRRLKFDNEEIYYTIDAINNAIASNHQVTFQYYHKIIVNRKAKLDKGREFTVSPYALLWANDKYYLVGNYGKYDDLSNYRLDRMMRVSVTQEIIRPFREVSPYTDFFDAADYLQKSFNMYNGEQELIELRCSNQILEAVCDKFGSNIEFSCHDMNAFTVRARVCISDGLIEWLLQYGSRITVQAPEHLRQKMLQQITGLQNAYGIS